MVTKVELLTQSINQFSQGDIRGRVDLMGMGNNVISAVISKDVVGDVFSGDAVEIVATSKGLPEVKPLTNGGDTFGFVRYNAKNSKYVAGDKIEMAMDGAVMVMGASEAIDAGDLVSYDYNTGLIAVAAGGAKVIGVALEAIDAEKMGRIIIKALDRKTVA